MPLLTERVATYLMRLKVPIVHLAYDSAPIEEPLRRAIDLLKRLGVDGRRIIVYCLYNYDDTPENFINGIQDLIVWGVVSYPMRYQSLKPEPKEAFVG